ncbi:MAG: hypothetical protein M1820_010740 [Bogoriella megaspora]|nr:MAG: hypothetical protein M1820_010740 [Bogoriella megaspora]
MKPRLSHLRFPTFQTCSVPAHHPPFRLRAHQTRNIFQATRRSLARTLQDTPRNPLDPIGAHRQEAIQRAYHVKRAKRAFAGAVICMALPVIIFYSSDIPTGPTASTQSSILPQERADSKDNTTETFAGKPIHVIPGGKVLAPDPDIAGTLNVTDDEYTLVGLGIRTVSFLSIQVYVVGMYVRTTDIATLQAAMVRQVDPIATTLVPMEKEKLRAKLMDPEEGKAAWDTLLKEGGIRTAVRVVPTRNTDFGHLRDGWVRGVTARTQEASKQGEMAYEDEKFGTSMRDFKALFGGKGKAPRGSVLLLTRDEKGKLGVLYQEKEGKGDYQHMGAVEDERISRLVWMGYLAGKNVSSEGARKGIVDGVMGFVERPVGTVETRVS